MRHRAPRRTRPRAASGLIALALLVCASALGPSSASARGACANELSSFSVPAPALRESVLCLVNETRLQRGLPALHRDSRLESAAQQHTDDMVANGYFAHPSQNGTSSATRMATAGYGWSPAGQTWESIGTGSATPQAVVELWLVDQGFTPPGHCQNILEPGARDLGVGLNSGVAVQPFHGVWTQDFGRLSTVGAPSAVTAPRDGCPYQLAAITPGPKPTATTSTATSITASSATVNGTANANGGGFTSYHLEYGTTTSYASQTLERIAGTAGATVTEPLSGLAAGTYHFRVVAMNQNGETRSVDRVFTTTGSPARPLVTTGSATGVTTTTATLNGSVNPAGRATTYHFEYGTTTGYGLSTPPVVAGSDTIAQAVAAAPSGLTPGTAYHARLVAVNSDGTTLGGDVSFTTLAPPTVATGSAGVAATTATLNGSVDPNGKATSYHFDYGLTTSYGSSTTAVSAGSGTTPQAVSATVSGLAQGTTYHVRIVATNSDGTANGADVSFTTLDPPIVATGAAAAGETTATLSGSVDPNGRATSYHFDYGATTSYGASTAVTSAGSGTTAQAVSAVVSALTRGTSYHARVVATNAHGTTYGTDVSFTTLDPPTVATGAAAAGETTATLNASVDPNGGATSYHFDYGTTTTYGSSTSATSAGSGSTPVAVSSALSGLTAGTTYHVRVVATNAHGTTFGGDVAFTTLMPPAVATGSVAAGQTTATLTGTVDPNGKPTSYRFDYGSTTAYGLATPTASAGSGDTAQAVSAAVSGLTGGTTYHVRIVATSGDGTSNGVDVTFTTTPAPLQPPTAVTGSASSVGATTATLNATVNPHGRATSYRFDRGTSTAYGTSTAAASAGSGTAPQVVVAALTGLTARTTYHVRVVASSSAGTVTGLDVTFTTASLPSFPPPPPPPPPQPTVAAITGLQISPSSFRAAKSGPSVTTSAVRSRTRTRVRYTLNTAAGVRLTVERSGAGRRIGTRCVTATRSTRSRSSCTRHTRVPGAFTRIRRAGTDRFTFAGRVGGRALRPGRYRLLVTPNGGRTTRAAFRVIR